MDDTIEYLVFMMGLLLGKRGEERGGERGRGRERERLTVFYLQIVTLTVYTTLKQPHNLLNKMLPCL